MALCRVASRARFQGGHQARVMIAPNRMSRFESGQVHHFLLFQEFFSWIFPEYRAFPARNLMVKTPIYNRLKWGPDKPLFRVRVPASRPFCF
jgi:hypothetical protein